MKIANILLMVFQVYGSFIQLENQNLMETTCRNTPNYSLCIFTLTASPYDATDVEGMALIMVEAVKVKAESALLMINELYLAHPEMEHELRQCVNTYNAVLKADVPEAVAGLTRGVPKFAESGMIDAVWETKICEAGFENSVMSPLSGANGDVKDLAEIAVAIIKNLL